ncbi:DUF1287 domain-containing protein [Pinibacter soli]|uniref:DUF1287 domain-containing protein n=1 Tax=Pinibacter soli TaxID=3044211 RepID=A0ABT6RAI2_9BACT|nr:DUF1287 domain-containing protein [Pinibacter soli]MDI3319528.1 DUF1287 domain-containing protein [Pinibacter soli]
MKKLLLVFCSLAIISAAYAQNDFETKLSNAAIALTKNSVTYDPTYYKIPYPNGDVPASKGVCTDVVIRAYRMLGIDLQKLIHEDMTKNFSKYPQKWGRKTPDSNIDHRRVPNQMTFFSRFGETKTTTTNPVEYTPGDVVTWDLGNGLTHIGIVIDRKSTDNKRYLIVHNIGNGQEISDCLFSFKIIGHYHYTGK